MEDSVAERVLILMGSLQEAEASYLSLKRNALAAEVCTGIEHLIHEIRRGVGTLLLGIDFLDTAVVDSLSECLSEQPTWSLIPIIILMNDSQGEATGEDTLPLLSPLGNVTILESPVRVGTLVTSVRSAIAYRKRQYEVRDLLGELETSREVAIEANRAKSDFLANISHEIRTPLGAVLGFAELLMDTGVTEREKNVYMTAIKRNGQMLSALINDILDLSKVESGRIELERIEFSLGEVISEVVSSLEPQASKKGLPLIVERSPKLPEFIKADPIRLKQILTNIVGNAVKFTSQGSIQMRLKIENCENGEIDLVIEIEDTGVGISSRQADRLFKSFTQADTSTTRRYGGTGLGLVLSQKLARAMGGDLKLQWSIPGGGSCFEARIRVEVQRQTRVPDPNSEEKPKPLIPPGLPLAGRHILVVDDSLDNQMLISRILKLLGSAVDLAGDGEEAITMAMKNPYDVVLMDLQMPKLGGVEATRRLREQGFEKPIVALTAHALKGDRQRCLSVGCTDYLTKPIQRQHLMQVLERVSRGH